MTVRVEITGNAHPALKRAMESLQGEGREQLLGHVGEYLMRSTRERAAREIAPDGSKWKPLSPGYARWKQKKRPGKLMLKFDGHMLGDWLAVQTDSQGLLFGSSAPYAARHQLGGKSEHAAHSRLLSFNRNKRTGTTRFAKRARANYEEWASVKSYSVGTPARPFLGLSKADDAELLEIATEHLEGALGGD